VKDISSLRKVRNLKVIGRHWYINLYSNVPSSYLCKVIERRASTGVTHDIGYIILLYIIGQ
jgi:hypothetical protein